MSRVAAGLLILLVALGAAGCGSTPGPATPALATRLERVDAAAVADDPEALASAVAGLLRAVEDAETAGDVSAGQADEIRVAARALLDAAEPDSLESPSEPDESTTTSAPPPDEDDEEDKEDEKDEKEDDRSGQGKGKGHDKDD